MRILIVSDTFLPTRSGIVSSTINIAGAIAHLGGHEVLVLAPKLKGGVVDESVGKNVSDASSLTFSYVPAISLSLLSRRPFVLPGVAGIVMARQIRDFEPDLIHVQTPGPLGATGILMASQRGIATVFAVHLQWGNVKSAIPLASFAPNLGKRLFTGWISALGRRATLCVVPTKAAREIVERDLGLTCVRYASNGLHYGALNRAESAPLQAGPGAGLRLLYVGRLAAEKSVTNLIEAMAWCKPGTVKSVTIVGSGPDRAYLESLAQTVAPLNVEFLGSVSDNELTHLYRSSDVFCMPGVCEYESIASLEALAAGLPVIAATSPALEELADWTGGVVLYAPSDSPHALANKIDLLAEDDARRADMSKVASSRIFQRFNRVSEWEALYADALKCSREKASRVGLDEIQMQHRRMPSGNLLSYYYSGASDAPICLILLHGIASDSRESWGNLLNYLRNEGQQHFEILAIDLPGHGSEILSDGDIVEDFASEMFELLSQVSAKPSVILGHSLGGIFAQVASRTAGVAGSPKVIGFILASTTCKLSDGLLTAPRVAGLWAINKIVPVIPNALLSAIGCIFIGKAGRLSYGRDANANQRFDWRIIFRLALEIYNFDSSLWIQKTCFPAVVIVTERDSVVGLPAQERLVDALQPSVVFRKHWTHEASRQSPQEYARAIIEAIKEIRSL